MKIPQRLLKVFSRLDGVKIYGYLTTPDVGTTSTSNPFQSFHVPEPNRLVKSGDVIRSGDNLLLLMEAPQTQLVAETFRAYGVTNQYPWKRTVKTIDPVARVERDKGVKDMGMVYAYFDKPMQTTLEGMTSTKYQFYTGQEVEVGDMVGGKMVKTIVPVLGVKLVVAE